MSELAVVLTDTARRVLPDGKRDPHDLSTLSAALRTAGLERPFLDTGGDLVWADVEGVVSFIGQSGNAARFADNIAADHLLGSAGLECRGALALGGDMLKLHENGSVSGRCLGVSQGEGVLVASASSRDGAAYVVALPTSAATIVAGASISDEARFDITFEQIKPLVTMKVEDDAALLAGALVRSLLIAGALQKVLALTIEHCRTRQQFGRPLAKFQAIQHGLARLASEAAASAAISHRASLARGLPSAPLAIAAAKIRTAAAARHAVDISHQCHGAIGFTAEYPLQLFTRRLLSWSSEFGGSRYWAKRLGQCVIASSQTPWALAVSISEELPT